MKRNLHPPVHNLLRTPHNVGDSSTICAELPTTLAARPQSAPTSLQRWRLVHNLLRLPCNVDDSSIICSDFPATLATRLQSAPNSPQRWQLVHNLLRLHVSFGTPSSDSQEKKEAFPIEKMNENPHFASQM